MSIFSSLLALSALVLLVALILYVIFGQITVRKLRSNPQTKEALGFEYMSGSDIANVAKILALPKKKSTKLKEGNMSFLYADIDRLYENTNKFDRLLAKLVYWSMAVGGISMTVLMVLKLVGVFD